MPAIRRFLLRILTLFRTDRAEADLAREIDAHLALLEDRFARDGMTPSDARAAALRAFGGVDQAKERQRDARAFRWIDDARRDVGYAVRSLGRSPAFTVAAVLTLSVGIGATTAIYSVVDTVLLQPLPFPDADRLVRIREPERPRTMQSTTYQEYLEWRSRSTTMSGLAAAALNPQVLIQTPGGAIRLSAGVISTNYFEVLRAEASLGRAIGSGDDRNRDVVVLSFDTWLRFFRGDPLVIGSVIELRSGNQPGRLMTVVGVMPDSMEQLGAVQDVYYPAAPPGTALGLSTLFGRLRDGISIVDASAEAEWIGEAVRPARPASAPPLTQPRFRAEALKDGVVASLRPALRIFLVAVVVVLLMASPWRGIAARDPSSMWRSWAWSRMSDRVPWSANPIPRFSWTTARCSRTSRNGAPPRRCRSVWRSGFSRSGYARRATLQRRYLRSAAS